MPARVGAPGRGGAVDPAVPAPLGGPTGPPRRLPGADEGRTALSHDLRLERVYAAPPEVVFDAFTDPDVQKELYADAPDWVVESACDLRVGGRWTIAFGPPGDPPARETNVFQVVE